MRLELLRKNAKAALYFYQKAFWYIGHAKNEALKPLGFWNETLLILTFLAVSDVRPSPPVIIGAYAIVLTIAAIAGKIIVATGIVQYNTKIANGQNPELMEILKKLGELQRAQAGKETVICPAIRTKTGNIIRGQRHSDAIIAARARNEELERTPQGQGFITSTGRYVDRKEALAIQQAAGIKSDCPSGYSNELYSEDLY